jgi:hypothetical protein
LMITEMPSTSTAILYLPLMSVGFTGANSLNPTEFYRMLF